VRVAVRLEREIDLLCDSRTIIHYNFCVFFRAHTPSISPYRLRNHQAKKKRAEEDAAARAEAARVASARAAAAAAAAQKALAAEQAAKELAVRTAFRHAFTMYVYLLLCRFLILLLCLLCMVCRLSPGSKETRRVGGGRSRVRCSRCCGQDCCRESGRSRGGSAKGTGG
jgi:hypothetical protein